MLPFIARPQRTKTPTQSSERGVDATGELYAACWKNGTYGCCVVQR